MAKKNRQAPAAGRSERSPAGHEHVGGPQASVDTDPRNVPESESIESNNNEDVQRQIQEAIARLTVTHQDVVIAVAGVTGAGKSKFISYISSEAVKVGHGMKSCTADVGIFPCPYKDGRTIYLVDTPGFNDTKKPDAEILETISVFFSALYASNIKLAGLIYLHRITDNRMEGSDLLNLEVFEKACGEDALKKVVLATTMWDMQRTPEDIELAEEREDELTVDFWADMLDSGSKMFRQDDGSRSAWKIVDYIMSLGQDGVVPKIARDLVDEGLTLKQTSAGKAVSKALIEAEERFEKKLASVEEKHKKAIAEGDEKKAAQLKEMSDKLAKQQADHKASMAAMDRTFAESQQALKDRVAQLETENQQAETNKLNDAKEIKALKDRETLREGKIAALERTALTNAENWNNEVVRLKTAQANSEAAWQARFDNMTETQRQSRLSKGGLTSTLSGIGTMVLGAATLNPVVIGWGATMAIGGGAAMAKRANNS